MDVIELRRKLHEYIDLADEEHLMAIHQRRENDNGTSQLDNVPGKR